MAQKDFVNVPFYGWHFIVSNKFFGLLLLLAFFVYFFVVSTILKVDKLNYWCLHASQGYGMRARVCVFIFCFYNEACCVQI